MFPVPKNAAQDTILRMWFLLRDPKRWTQGVFARDAKGSWVSYASDRAVCWCERGALGKIEGRHLTGPTAMALMATVPTMRKSVVRFNDSRDTSHNDILAHLCRAYDYAGQL